MRASVGPSGSDMSPQMRCVASRRTPSPDEPSGCGVTLMGACSHRNRGVVNGGGFPPLEYRTLSKRVVPSSPKEAIVERSREQQTTSTLLMIRPVAFAYNAETAETNRFQDAELAIEPAEAQRRAGLEFDGLVSALRGAGVRVLVFDDTPEPHTPDALFPNNWISFHGDGTQVIYPLQAENRRREVRSDVLEALAAEHGLAPSRTVDLRALVPADTYLEGTGSLVLDRAHAIAYACHSPRTHAAALERFALEMSYQVIAFHAVDAGGVPVYHTNVLLCVGRAFAALCTPAISDRAECECVTRSLRDTGHDLIELSFQQMDAFAGNMLEVQSDSGEARIIMSASARRSLMPEQLECIERHGEIVATPLETIEGLAGGSARCMLAEVFLPRRRLHP